MPTLCGSRTKPLSLLIVSYRTRKITGGLNELADAVFYELEDRACAAGAGYPFSVGEQAIQLNSDPARWVSGSKSMPYFNFANRQARVQSVF